MGDFEYMNKNSVFKQHLLFTFRYCLRLLDFIYRQVGPFIKIILQGERFRPVLKTFKSKNTTHAAIHAHFQVRARTNARTHARFQSSSLKHPLCIQFRMNITFVQAKKIFIAFASNDFVPQLNINGHYKNYCLQIIS